MLLNSCVLSYIPRDTFYDLPMLFKDLKEKSMVIKGYMTSDFWMDIGRKEDYWGIKKNFEL